MTSKKKAKKTKAKKREKERRQVLLHLSLEDALKAVRDMVDEGRPKEALQMLQQVSFGEREDFKVLRMRAYAMRARQLEDKELQREAATVVKILREHFSNAPALTCADSAMLVRTAPISFGIECYREHGKRHPSCAMVERALCDQLVVRGGWENVASLPGDDPVKKDSVVMSRAVPQFDGGRWEEALESLGGLPRKSPFASWKWFAKAMASAYQREEKALQRALAQIPEDFPLQATVRTLRDQGIEGVEALHHAAEPGDQLDIQRLTKAIRRAERNLSTLIFQYAHELFPENQRFAARSLSEMAAMAMSLEDRDIKAMEKALPAEFVKPILLRMQTLNRPPSARGWDYAFYLAKDYTNYIDAEFSHLENTDKVEAAVFYLLVSRAVSQNVSPMRLLPPDCDALRKWIGDTKVKQGDLFAAAAEKITRLESEVAAYYKFLSVRQFLSGTFSGEGKKRMEKNFLRMQKHFPDDPFSYLQLAQLYWSKSAYRKSQQMLEKGYAQAPYDPQVKEEYGLGLLRAAVKSRKRGAYHLVRRDLHEAAKLNVIRQLPVIQALLATLPWMEGEAAHDPVEMLKSIEDPVVRYRAMIYLYLDSDQLKKKEWEKSARKAAETLATQLKKEIKQLSAEQLNAVTAPVPSEYGDILMSVNPALLFDALWPQILKKLDDQQVLMSYAQILGGHEEKDLGTALNIVEKDLKRRLRSRKKDIYLRFFKALINYLDEPETGAEPFMDVIESISREQEQKLRDFCMRIYRFFSGELRTALKTFDFMVLEENELWGWDLPLPLGELEDEDLEEDLGRGPSEAEIEDILEKINEMGEDKQVLQMFFEMVLLQLFNEVGNEQTIREWGWSFSDKAPKAFEALKKIYTGKKKHRLTQEAKWFLFPDE